MTWLAEAVRSEGGRVTFERFMELALYHPAHGYYTEHISEIGRSGDFSTAMTIGGSLVRSVASWLKAEAKQLSMPVTKVIELGGGTGRLASGILRSFMPWQRIRYQIVEVSKALRQVQQRELRGKQVQWKDSVEAALQAAKGEAILISNEFVDAFPCQRFERGWNSWKEISLTLQGDLWSEESSESRALPASSVFAVDYAAGQRVETLQSYRNWLTNLDRFLHRGAILTIDYGGTPDQIYHRRPGGTMRAYFRHQRIDGMGIYLRPGRQDLTSDVNFVDLREWGQQLGLDTVQLVTQAEFIRNWANPGTKEQQLADQYIADESGAGEAFKVLHQRKR
ncbi:MAG TPA: SAM-dependent methyltransferase [Chthoniobacterales bacterium]|jgi:SAM-dependent MidA family methyltransferase|nr:SAM-dependent methyltransferase [Chthoniobacterales bacterium]